MSWAFLTPALVEAIHDRVLNPGELTGLAGDKSLEGVLARVENRVIYGMIEDRFDLAAAYAMAIARGHCFNDGNKRTAYETMVVSMALNGLHVIFDPADIGPRIIDLAQGRMDEDDLAAYLRQAAPKA